MLDILPFHTENLHPVKGMCFICFPKDLTWSEMIYICYLGFCGLLWKFGRPNGNNSVLCQNSVEQKPAVLPILNYSATWQMNFSGVWLVGRFNICRHDWNNYQIVLACISSPPSHSSQSWPLLLNISPLLEAKSGIPACQNIYKVLHDVKQNCLVQGITHPIFYFMAKIIMWYFILKIRAFL